MRGPRCEIRVTGVREPCPTGDDIAVVNVTSRSKEEWSIALSPFFLGPCDRPKARIFENAWQYAKVYAEFADAAQNPTADYYMWAEQGFNNDEAVRFPMGRGAKPLYTWFEGQKLGYISARKALYAPLYEELAGKTEAFRRLKTMFECGRYRQIWLRDFDGYDHVDLGMTLLDVGMAKTRNCSHSHSNCSERAAAQDGPRLCARRYADQ
jgi:hypothetical protein